MPIQCSDENTDNEWTIKDNASRGLIGMARTAKDAAGDVKSLQDRLAEVSKSSVQARVGLQGGKAPSISSALCYIVDDQFLVGVDSWSDQAQALQRRDELIALPAQTLNEDGDRYTIDGRDLLIQIAPTSVNASIQYMLRGTVAAPDWEVDAYHLYLRAFAALWKQAR